MLDPPNLGHGRPFFLFALSRAKLSRQKFKTSVPPKCTAS